MLTLPIAASLADTFIARVRGAPATDLAGRRGIQRNFGNRPFSVSDRLVDAIAQLQVLGLPSRLEEAIEATNEYVDRLADERTQAVKDEWTGAYARLHAAIRATCGAVASGDTEKGVYWRKRRQKR